MRKLFALVMALLLLSGTVPAGQAAEPAENVPEGDITLNVYNWGQYIADGSDDSLDIIAAFEEKYPNIHVNYSTFDSNEIMYTKLASGGITVDLVIPSDYMVARMAEEGMLLELNFDNIPNYQYIADDFKGMPHDPEDKYSVPYTWGTVGIIYNTKYVDEEDLTGWELMWNEKYADKILMFDNSRDAFGIASFLLGYGPNTTDETELQHCADKLAEQVPLVQQYVMDQIYDLMENEEAWIAPYYVGDYMTMAENNEDLAFYLPEHQGFNRFVDAMCIPNCAKEKEAAELFINFLCDPEIMAANMDWVGYSMPLKDEYIDPELLEDTILYPDKSSGTPYENLDPSVTRFMESLFLEVRVRNVSNDATQQVMLWCGIVVGVAVVAALIGYGVKKKRK